jgi:error-prone DNA polymerase
MPGTPPYVELHAHSAYSFLDGTSMPDELAERALALGHQALALTDHDSLSGAMELAVAAGEMGLKAIFGAEVTVAMEAEGQSQGSDRAGRARAAAGQGRPGAGRGGPNASRGAPGAGAYRHLTLLVRDRRGWRNLCRLLTCAHAHTRDGPGRRGRDKAWSSSASGGGQPSVTLGQVCDHAEGLVCLSGCAVHGVHERQSLRALREAFGPRSLRVELQRPYAREDRARNRTLERLAGQLGVATVATGDVHAHTQGRALLQDAFVALRHGLTLDASDCVRRPNHTHVLARPEAMAARFAAHPEAVAESVRLAEELDFDLRKDLGYSYPGAERPDAVGALTEVCEAEFFRRYPRGSRHHEQAAARLRHELATIETLGLAGFFLLHHEIFVLAAEVAGQVRGRGSVRGLLAPGRGRGSSVSSIVCYLTGLSHIDPIASELSMGRFLHAEIQSLPDIDLDFPRDVRERLIPRVHERYGAERSALVAAFPTFRSRGTVRELGKALGLPPGEIERVARCADGWGGQGAVREAVEAALGKRRAASGRWRWLTRLADEARGLPRHVSQHSGGMIIATRPLIDCCPVIPAAMAGRQIAQWDKDSCSDAGFLKIDLLGLGMLSAVERCVQLIHDDTGERVDLSRIDFDDDATFECIQSAETTGVFQIESRAQMGSLRRTRPASLQDLTVQVALVRPGPIVGGAVNPYIERRRRQLEDPHYEIPYAHPSLQGPLKDTLGTIVFQDQVIEVAQAFSGFSQSRAEGLRRAMSRKRSQEAMERHHTEFVQGALATHPDVSVPLAEEVWGMVSGFAGFGFPKAHGAAFGLLAYQSTWLRVHHPVAFLCALLNEQPMGFYAPDSLIHEAQRRGVKVLGPDVSASELACTLTAAGEVRVGLGYVRGLGKEDASALLSARRDGGPFADLGDLASRAGIPRAALQLLAWAGACDALAGGGPRARRTALWQLGVAVPARRLAGGAGHADAAGHAGAAGLAGAAGRAGARGSAVADRRDDAARQPVQLALDLDLAGAPSSLPQLGEWEAMLADYSASGVSIERHPLALLRERLHRQGVACSAELAGIAHGSDLQVAGLVIARQRPSTAKGVTFLLLEDELGTVNLIVPPALYERRRALVRGEPLLLATGRLERHADGNGAINVLASELQTLPVEEDASASVTDLQRRRQRRAGAAPRVGAGEDAEQPAGAAGDFRAVAPAVTSFAQGRR